MILILKNLLNHLNCEHSYTQILNEAIGIDRKCRYKIKYHGYYFTSPTMFDMHFHTTTEMPLTNEELIILKLKFPDLIIK